MFETVTVDEALARGRRTVNLPIFAILFIPVILSFFLVIKYEMSGWLIASGFGVGFIAAWLYWSTAITKWRVWAFENVRNVHELQKRAIKMKLIWPDGSFWARTEIWSAADRDKWANLQYRFDQPDIFKDETSVATETIIRYSINNAIGVMLIGAVFFIGGGWLAASGKELVIGLIGVAIGVGLAMVGRKHYINRDPQIIISDKGIQTKDIPFYSWDQITNEDTKTVQQGKTRRIYFIYTCPQGDQSLLLNEYDITTSNLEKALRTYRGRFENRNINKQHQ